MEPSLNVGLAVSIDEEYVRKLVEKYGLDSEIDRVVDMLLNYPMLQVMSEINAILPLVDKVVCPYGRDGICTLGRTLFMCFIEQEEYKSRERKDLINKLMKKLGITDILQDLVKYSTLRDFAISITDSAPCRCVIDLGNRKMTCKLVRAMDMLYVTCREDELEHTFVLDMKEGKIICSIHQALVYEVLRRYVQKLSQQA